MIRAAGHTTDVCFATGLLALLRVEGLTWACMVVPPHLLFISVHFCC